MEDILLRGNIKAGKLEEVKKLFQRKKVPNINAKSVVSFENII